MTSLTAEQANTLDLFSEKFGKLRRSSVWKAIEENDLRFSLKATQGEPLELHFEGPTEEAVDAFVLTLRFFLQNNESISIRNLAVLAERLPLDQGCKDRLAEGRQRFNAFLDTPCPIEINSLRPTHREVMDIFIYGGMAHANPAKYEVFSEWASQRVVFGIMNQVFYSCLLEILTYLAFFDANLRDGLPGRDSGN